MRRKIFVVITIGLMLMTLTASGKLWQAPSLVAKGSSYEVNIDTNVEYSNGSIGSSHEGLALWYAWVNASGTQIIFLAYHSYTLNPPIITFLGQHYYIEDNTEVFVGNTLSLMEIYNDTNGNGLPDADYASGKTEILYDFQVNSSVSFQTTPIERTLKNGLPHYTWGIRYQTIDGFLTTEDSFPVARLMIDYMDFSYDFYIQNNVSYTKTNFGIGKIFEMTPFGSFTNASVSLEGLSLALFYGTAVVTAKPYVTLVNGSPYNSTTAPPSVQPADLGEIKIDDTKAYEFVFGQNYTLFQDSQQETHESKSTAVSNQSVTSGLGRFEWIFSDLEAALASLFPKISSMQAAINLDYSVSSLLYRVCYPVWNGCKLEHDPTYIAFLNTAIVPELGPPLTFVVVAALVSAVVLTMALVDLKKTRRILRYSAKIPSTTIR
jgi:hypothetical protein